jgi:3,4-dihydroxy 2-butanone 4-phosphate synthase/GTP cyclohydrolase II
MRIKLPEMSKIAKANNLTLEELNERINVIKTGMDPIAKRIPVVENGTKRHYSIERKGVGPIRTALGEFWQFAFEIDDQWGEYTVIVKADINKQWLAPVFKNAKELILRTDSGCITGQVFGDLTCDCFEQLHLAMKTISEAGEGMIIHIPRQDGRGMGIPFKLATLWLQEELGVDTVESASIVAPSGVIDVRTYSGVVGILKFFGIPETCCINLATNNPKKAEVFEENGYVVSGYTPIRIKPNKHTERHLKAKQDHLGHQGLVPKE